MVPTVTVKDPAWAELLGRLPFGPGHARRLVRIGASARLRTHVSAIPSDIETLDKLAVLSSERRDDLLAADAIHPGMARGDLDILSKAEVRAAKECELAVCTA